MGKIVLDQKEAGKSGVPAGEVIDLATMVAYVDGSIVSRTLGTGAVTLFAFDAGQSLSEHTAPMDALVQVLDGTGTIRIQGQPHAVGPGQIIMMPANVPHAVVADSRFKMLLIMLRGTEGYS